MVGHRLKPWSGRAVVAVGAMVVLTACSSDGDRLDRSATERAIERVVEADIAETVAEVNCPERIPYGEGLTVRCEAVFSDVAGRVGLEVTQLAGDELDVIVLDAVVDPAEVADELEKQLLATYLRTFTAGCGEPGRQAVASGSTLACTVTDDDGSREATVTVVDASGTLSFLVAGDGN